jgi:hypothetical protein
MKGAFIFFRAVYAPLFLLPLLLNVFSCSKKTAPPEETQIQHEKYPPPTALVQTGAVPLWVEFDGKNLNPLSSPEAAALKLFVPWTVAEHVTGIVRWGAYLAIAVNRGGVWLVKEAADGLFQLYLLRETQVTPLYTMLEAFNFQGKPAFLLYRDDFFVEHDIPPPLVRAFTVKDDISGLEAVEIPAFSGFSGAEGWDIEDFFTAGGSSGDSSSYFKAVKKGVEAEKISYIRTENLSVKGEEITFGAYMSAAMEAAGGSDTASPPLELPAGLPALPENFVYTAYSRIAGINVVSWEERENWNIGAAGLLFLPASPASPARVRRVYPKVRRPVMTAHIGRPHRIAPAAEVSRRFRVTQTVFSHAVYYLYNTARGFIIRHPAP